VQLAIDEATTGQRVVKPQFTMEDVEGQPSMVIHFSKLVRLSFDNYEDALRFARRIMMQVSQQAKKEGQRGQLPLIK
jgi:hypothetical protein